jgi:hypothetical protein
MRAGCMHHYSLTLKVVAHSAHSRFLMVFVLTFFGNILIHGAEFLPWTKAPVHQLFNFLATTPEA